MRHSVVVPVLDEAESIPQLFGEIVAALEPLDGGFEVVFVDDGARDRTAECLGELAAADDRCRVIRFTLNRGKSAAYMAGFRAARGERILTLDGDLQDAPAEIPRLLEALDGGLDLVVGAKQGRFANEPTRTLSSKCFNGIKRVVFGLALRDTNSGFRAMDRRVAESLELYGDQYRFVPELAHAGGYRVGEIAVQHRPRQHGRSKYGPARLWTGLLDVITVRFVTRYAERPLHFFGTLGMVPLLSGVALELYVLVWKLQGSPFRLHVAAIIIGALLIMTGVQTVCVGLIGEMLALAVRRIQAGLPVASSSNGRPSIQ